MTVEEFEPKYPVYELINYSEGTFSMMTKTEAVERYGKYEIVSVKDYDRTMTTSIIIRKPRKHDRAGIQRDNQEA